MLLKNLEVKENFNFYLLIMSKILQKILSKKNSLIRYMNVFILSFYTTFILTDKVLAAEVDPASHISLIIERVIQIMTQIGSAVLLLYIVKDAFTILERKDDPMVRSMILRDVFLLIVAAIFLFNPNLILDAIRFIANV